MLRFPHNLYALSFVAAFLSAWLSLPLWRRAALRWGIIDDPGHRKIHTTPVPLAGGFAVLTGLSVPVIAGTLAFSFGWISPNGSHAISHGLERRSLQLAAILCGAMAMLILGLLDDRFELSPRWKFLGQLFIASSVAAAGVRITLFIPSVAVSYVVTVLWILTLTNAFNFMDNMNGLCAGTACIGAWFFSLTAASQGQYLVTLIGLIVCGALLGFLPHNFPKATSFLGDAGSHLTGFLLSVLAILPHFYTAARPNRLAVLQPLFFLAVPLLDLVCVVLLRWRMGKPFYIGDTNHFSHRLVRAGCSKPLAVLILWGAATLAGALCFLA